MTTPAAVVLRDVHKSFGLTKIIHGVSLEIPRGQRHAIIGPNGAGKTTLFNMISNRVSATSGEIELNGRPVHNLPPHEINRLGLSRSFQTTSLFHRLSVFENVRCALLWSRGYGYSIRHLLWRQHDLNAAAERLLDRLNLRDRRATCRG